MRRRLCPVLAALLVALLASCQAQVTQQATDAKVYMVPMRDGVELSTVVVLPKGEGPWPVILSRTPYGKMAAVRNAPGIVRQGYARVVQDLRGRFASGGTDNVFLTDAWGDVQDGYDAIEWIAGQPWCDGKVGMIGGSALGITQYLAAGSAHPSLKACQAVVACASLYHHAVYQGGAFRKALVENWMKGNKFSDEAFTMVTSNPLYNDLWQSVDLSARAPTVNTPIIHTGGWYDVFAQGTLDAFDALQHRGGEGARGNQRLVFGPWTHGCKPGGELSYPPNASQNPAGGLQAAWFDRWLRGGTAKVLDRAPVNYYVMGACGESGAPGNQWREADDWPPPATQTPLYLHSSVQASFDPPDGTDANRSFAYNPQNPVPTVGGCNLTIPKGSFDQRPVEDRDDVLLYETEALAEPLEVTGRLRAKLYVSSDCPDTDFTAKLTDVYPDGRSMLVCDGILRMRFRNGFEKEELMEPGEVYEAFVDLWSTSIIFNKGHRIRVAVSSSNSPRFDPNPNTGEGFSQSGKTRVAANTVYSNKDHPSQIILPIPDE